MRMLRNKSKVSTVALVLVLTIAATLITLPVVTAQRTIPTIAYLSFRPNPIGIGQTLLVNVWLTPSLHVSRGYDNFTVTITKPDTTTETIKLPKTWSDGTQWFEYVVDKVGTWYFQFSFPGQTFPADPTLALTQDTYLPSNSPKRELIVQQEPIPQWPAAELPTDYWTRPIYGENREWYTIGGDWLQTYYNASRTSFNPYSKGPNTAHVFWKRQTDIGGLVGGEEPGRLWSWSYGWTAAEYPPRPHIVIAGLAYYNTYDGIHCINIHTGEELWVKPGSVSVGAHELAWRSGALVLEQVVPYLFSIGATFVKYDAFTGAVVFNQTGFLSATYVEPYAYSTQTIAGTQYLIKWNTTTAAAPTWTLKDRIAWNVTSPIGVSYVWNDIGVAIGRPPAQSGAINLTNGEILWNRTLPEEERMIGGACVAYGKIFVNTDGMVFRAYDLLTGRKVWTSEPASYPWGSFWTYTASAAYGYVYGLTHGDGTVYCYDAETGKIKWKYYVGSSGFETPYGTFPFWGYAAIADGKIYVTTGEHSADNPRYRGSRLYCLNAITGDYIWSISSFSGCTGGSTKVIADGMLISMNEYDSVLYCFGKGQTATTVSASPKTIANGATVLIEGTVLDQSAAQPGTPCVSKESMTAWMEYLHMQKPMPTNVTGVPVKLLAMLSNGSIIEIGTVTSDLKGHFSYMWNPPTEDLYTITATFAGDDSYWSSWEETALGVTAAPQATPEAAAPAYTTIDLVIIAAVVVAICLVLYTLYTVRKQRK